MLKWIRRLYIPILLALIIAVFLIIGSTADSYQNCKDTEAQKQNQAGADTDNNPFKGVLPFFKCESIFGSDNAEFITAIATIVIGVFTWTLRASHKSHVRHIREVERAYISGGGPTRYDAQKHIWLFVLTVENTGKTPGTITDYSLFLSDRADLPREPAYLNSQHVPIKYIARIPPVSRTMPVTERPITQSPNLIAYGRFRYVDVWMDEHQFCFIVPINSADDHTLISGVSPKYTYWD